MVLRGVIVDELSGQPGLLNERIRLQSMVAPHELDIQPRQLFEVFLRNAERSESAGRSRIRAERRTLGITDGEHVSDAFVSDDAPDVVTGGFGRRLHGAKSTSG